MQEAGWLQARAIWHNMREEPVIYINGAPFVLREDERPFKNLQVGPHQTGGRPPVLLAVLPLQALTGVCAAVVSLCGRHTLLQTSAPGRQQHVPGVHWLHQQSPALLQGDLPSVMHAKVHLQEYTGIDFKRLEQMELRLKNDILQESKSYRCRWPPALMLCCP